MFIMKLALLSCAFYLGFALVAELAFFATLLWKDDVIIGFKWWGWTVWSGAICVVCTSLENRAFSSGRQSRASHFRPPLRYVADAGR
jgi:hypothetical protein